MLIRQATTPALSTKAHVMRRESVLSQRALWATGQPISYLMSQALAHPELISLAAGFVDQETLPVEPTRKALDAILSDPKLAQAALQYGSTPGYLPLREQVLERLKQQDSLQSAKNLSVEQTVVTAGSNELLNVVVDTLCDPGDIVLTAAPSYFVFLGMLANMGVRAIGVDADQQGILPEAVEEQLSRLDVSDELSRVKAIYVTTYFDNPGGVTLAAARRGELVEIAKRWSKQRQIYIIEDAAYRELRYRGDDTPSLRSYDEDGDTVISTHTFSKSYSPGVRVGYGVLPPALAQPVLDQKGNIDFGSPNFSQHLMSKVLELGLFDRHVQRLREGYRVKLDAMLSAADRWLSPLPDVSWHRPDGGLYVWLQLPEHIDTDAPAPLFKQAMAEGVLYVPGKYCYAQEGAAPHDNMIRLSFGVQSPERIREGVAALSRAIRGVMTD